jgi:predicted nucleic acid-binding Zn ribbon protein
MRKSSSKSLDSALNDVIGSLGIEKKLREYRAVTEWDAVVGSHIAKESTPMKIIKGVLVVRVRRSTWRNELLMRKPEIIQKLNDALGEGTVKDIRFQ